MPGNWYGIRTSPALSAAVMSIHGINDAVVRWGYRQIVCEGCISEEYQITVENLRYVMENHFGLVPCPGI